MNLFEEMLGEFKEDFEKNFVNSPETLEASVQSVIDTFSFDIGMEIKDLFSFKDSQYLVSKLKSEIYESRKGRKNRLVREVRKNAPMLSMMHDKSVNEIFTEVEIWNAHPNDVFLIKAPYFSDVLTERIAYNNFMSDLHLYLYDHLTTILKSFNSETYTFPQNVHDVVSISNKTSIKPFENQSIAIPTSTTTVQYPSSVNFYKAIDESVLSLYKQEAIKEHAYKYFTTFDLKVFGFICNKLKVELFNNEMMVSFSLREMIKHIFTNYRAEYEEKVISSIVKITLLKIIKNGLVMGFLANHSFSTKDSEIIVTTTLDSFIAQQIKENQVIQLDKRIYDIIQNDMAQALILPMQTYRFREYLTKKNKKLSQESLKIDWIWVSKHLSVPFNSKPSVIMDRIEAALNEFQRKTVLIDRYLKQKNTFIVYLKDISEFEEKFIDENYKQKDITIEDSIKSLT